MDETARRWAEKFLVRRDHPTGLFPYAIEVLGRRHAAFRLEAERDAVYYGMRSEAAAIIIKILKGEGGARVT